MSRRPRFYAAVIVAALLLGAVGLACLFTCKAKKKSYLVETGSGGVVATKWVRPSRYIELYHGGIVPLYAGDIRVEIVVKGRKMPAFSANEEMDLYAVHVQGTRVLMILEDCNTWTRGFMAFESLDEGDFRQIDVQAIPPPLAYPNVGNPEEIASHLLSKSWIPEPFYTTQTARLWSQMATGKVALSHGTDRDAVDAFWYKWRTAINSEIRPSKEAH